MKTWIGKFIELSAGGYSQEYSGYQASPGEDVSWAILPTYTNSAFQVSQSTFFDLADSCQIFWDCKFLHQIKNVAEALNGHFGGLLI